MHRGFICLFLCFLVTWLIATCCETKLQIFSCLIFPVFLYTFSITFTVCHSNCIVLLLFCALCCQSLKFPSVMIKSKQIYTLQWAICPQDICRGDTFDAGLIVWFDWSVEFWKFLIPETWMNCIKFLMHRFLHMSPLLSAFIISVVITHHWKLLYCLHFTSAHVDVTSCSLIPGWHDSLVVSVLD